MKVGSHPNVMMTAGLIRSKNSSKSLKPAVDDPKKFLRRFEMAAAPVYCSSGDSCCRGYSAVVLFKLPDGFTEC